MVDFDTISKTHARAYPIDFINHCLDFDQDDVTFVQLILEETVKKYSIAIIESWLSSQQSPQVPILEALEIRFGADAAQTFKPALDAIDDLQRLEQLFDAAVSVNNVADFRRALETNDVKGFLELLERRKRAMPQYSEAYPRAKTKTS